MNRLTPIGHSRTVSGVEPDMVIPEGAGGVWNAASPNVGTAEMLQAAAREASRTRLPQIVHLPGGKTVTIHPEVTAA